MTARQFKLALDKLGLSQMGAGRMLGIDGRTVRRYVADGSPGARGIPEPLAKLLRLAVAGKVSVEDIEEA